MDLLFFLAIVPAYHVGKYFIANDPGPPEPKKGLETAIGFGILALVITLALSVFFDALLFSSEYNAAGDPVALSFLNVLVHASVEEFAKFIPLALFIYHRPYFNENTDGIIYFSLVGLTFGAIETFFYSLSAGGIFTIIMRLTVGLFFHAALTSLVGLFLARSKVYHSSLLPSLLALIGASLIHTLYNYALFMSIGDSTLWLFSVALALVINSLMFWEYFVAAEHDKLLKFENYSNN